MAEQNTLDCPGCDFDCPECGKHSHYTNIGKSQWGYCTECQCKWMIGSFLSTWQYETLGEQEAQYNEIGLGDYRQVTEQDGKKTTGLYEQVECPKCGTTYEGLFCPDCGEVNK